MENDSNSKNLGLGLVLSIIIMSILFGAVSGFISGYYAQRGIKNQSANSQQSISIDQNSASISVVKKTSPAVVSIIISKNLVSAQNDFNPFFFDPFSLTTPSQGNGSSSLQQIGAGSGFFISADGLILTNNHVVSDAQAQYTVITNDGKKYDATVVATDSIKDLALVKIKISNAPTLSFADS